jgi:hypothetical protein
MRCISRNTHGPVHHMKQYRNSGWSLLSFNRKLSSEPINQSYKLVVLLQLGGKKRHNLYGTIYVSRRDIDIWWVRDASNHRRWSSVGNIWFANPLWLVGENQLTIYPLAFELTWNPNHLTDLSVWCLSLFNLPLLVKGVRLTIPPGSRLFAKLLSLIASHNGHIWGINQSINMVLI